MDNNMYSGAVAPQPQGEQQQKGSGGLKMDSKMMGIIAAAVVVVLVILIAAIAGSGAGKAKKAVKTYVKVFISGEKKANDVKWTKYYPKDFDRELDDWADAYAKSRKSSFEDVEKYKVLSVTKLSGKEIADILEEGVEAFFTSEVTYYSEKKIESRDLRDVKVSKGYLVVTEYEYDGDLCVVYWIVIKANGRYGVYYHTTILAE